MWNFIYYGSTQKQTMDPKSCKKTWSLHEKSESTRKISTILCPLCFKKGCKGVEAHQTTSSPCSDIQKNREKGEKKETKVTCQGCIDDQPNQLAHMDVGGCLELDRVWVEEDSESDPDW